MDLTRLLAPRSVAVVGASPRPNTYGNQAIANLLAAGFDGPVWGVHPSADEVLGVRCVRRLADLPQAPDAVVIATPAATVPNLVDEAGQLGVGGVVVIAAGFAEVDHGRPLQDELRSRALRHDLPVCGPNGNGLVAVHRRAPLWGDAYNLGRAGGVALISQSGNVAVNAIGTRRGLWLHTVVSCGNQAVLDAADYLVALATQDGVRSVALYLETDGDGARLAQGLAACAERRIGVTVLKSGRSTLGASAAAAHTGAVAGDARVLQALVQEAGAVWVDDPNELLETAKAMATGRRTIGAGVAIITCSGGDAAIAADQAEQLNIPLPPLSAHTKLALEPFVPAAATIANPLDYTAMIWGETERIGAIVRTTAADPALAQVLVYYDRPQKMDQASTESWDATLDGILLGAANSVAPVVIASTLADLLPEETVEHCLDNGVPAVWGLTTGLRVVEAMRTPFADPSRLTQIADLAGRRAEAGPWLAEHEAKALLATSGVVVPNGHVVRNSDESVRAACELGGAVALKLSSATLQHKSDVGALELNVQGDERVAAAFDRLRALPGHESTPVLVEEMAAPGVELLVSARRDAVVPVVVVGLGGLWVEMMSDAVVIPLPADAGQVEQALRRLRGAPLLTGGRGTSGVDLHAVADLAVRVGKSLFEHDLVLVELNPVFARADGVTAVDAVARRAG